VGKAGLRTGVRELVRRYERPCSRSSIAWCGIGRSPKTWRRNLRQSPQRHRHVQARIQILVVDLQDREQRGDRSLAAPRARHAVARRLAHASSVEEASASAPQLGAKGESALDEVVHRELAAPSNAPSAGCGPSTRLLLLRFVEAIPMRKSPDHGAAIGTVKTYIHRAVMNYGRC